MPSLPSFAEELSSHIPAVQLLMALGYDDLPPERALRLQLAALGWRRPKASRRA